MRGKGRVVNKRHRGKEVKPGGKQRCRKCGKEYANEEWKAYNVNNIANKYDWEGYQAQSHVLRNSVGNKVWEVCTVPSSLYAPGFTCMDVIMPWRKCERKKRL